MSRVRLYVDEDAAEKVVVDGLARAGFDVLTAIEAAAKSASDEAQLLYAAAEGRAIYTLNVSDFARLHGEFMAAGKNHAGVIVIPRQGYAPGEKLRRILAIIEATTAEELRNQIRFL